MTKFKGTGVAMVTPFNNDESINFDQLKKLTNHLIDGGVEYLVGLGTTGEVATLDASEKEQVFARLKEYIDGRVPLACGIGGNNTRAILDSIKNFDFEAVDAVLSVSPYYNKPNQQGIINHYTAIADASPRPVILYNVPGRTGSNMTAETTLKLAEHENIIAMKEASGNFEQIMEIVKHKPEGFLVLSGDDALTLPLMSVGLDGVISVIANAYPADFSQMVRDCLAGDFIAARKKHYRLIDLMNTIFADGSPGGIKEILKEMGITGTEMRLPLAPVSDAVRGKLLELAKQY